MKFRPCIDLHAGVVKQIVGGTLRDDDDDAGGDGGVVTNFEASKTADYFSRMYAEDKLTGGHVIMLGPGNTEAAKAAVAAYPGGLQVGGGITPDNAAEWLEAGAAAVIVTSYVFRDGVLDRERLAEIRRVVPRERLVLDLSCRRRGDEYFVVTDRWQKFTTLAVTKETLDELATHCAEFLVHGVDVEGLRAGIEAPLVEALGKWSPIPVTYAGGVRSLDDVETVRSLGGGRVDVTIGSALDIFGGVLPYRDVVAWHKAAAAGDGGDGAASPAAAEETKEE